jgi:hypothetical protein
MTLKIVVLLVKTFKKQIGFTWIIPKGNYTESAF